MNAGYINRIKPSYASYNLWDSSDNKHNGRDQFQIDIDRIFFSRQFRKLATKTQAFPLHTGVIHTRLTHSLEVACIARSLGSLVAQHIQGSQYANKLDYSKIPHILYASSLIHDIGNPPFGHKGEEAIKSWFRTNHEKFDSILDDEARQDFFCLMEMHKVFVWLQD